MTDEQQNKNEPIDSDSSQAPDGLLPDIDNNADIDSLLSSVEESLEDMDNQLGENDTVTEDSPASAENTVPETPFDEFGPEPQDESSQVDDTLEQLEKDLGDLMDNIQDETGENSDSEPQADDSEEVGNDNVNELLNSLEAELEEIENPPDPQNLDNNLSDTPPPDFSDEKNIEEQDREKENTLDDVDEILSTEDLEIEDDLPESEPIIPIEIDDLTDPTPDETTNDIDSQLAELADEITEEATTESALETISTDKENEISSDPENENIDQALSSLEEEMTETASGENLDDVSSSETEVEITADVDQTQLESNPETEESIDIEENIVLDELAVATGEKQPDPATEAVQAPEDPYAHFNKTEKMLIKTVRSANKPFQFIPEKTKEIMGLVAVVTLLISMFTTAMILMFK